MTDFELPPLVPDESAAADRAAAAPLPAARRAALWPWALLLALLALAFVIDVALGAQRLPLGDVLRSLLNLPVDEAVHRTIVIDYRLPRALVAGLAGGALALGGLQMQTLFRNPLAGPDVLGISSGASLGVALVLLLGGGGGRIGLVLGGVIGAAAVLVLIVAVSRRVANNMTLLILGLLFGYATGAVVGVLFSLAPSDRVVNYVQWSLGSFGGVDWPHLRILAPVLIGGIVLTMLLTKSLNALLLGDGYARTLGLRVERARLGVLIATALLAGGVTAFCGPIGFVGIAVPHLVRGLFGTANHRVLVPGVCLAGAIATLLADLVTQLSGLPLNSITALIGAPIVAWVILRQRNLREGFAG